MSIDTRTQAYYFQDPLTQSIPCWDEDSVEQIYQTRKTRGGFFAEQEYSNNDINKYVTFYIYDIDEARFEYVADNYMIRPQEGYFFEGIWYYKFILPTGVTHHAYEECATVLADMYKGKYAFYRPHDYTDTNAWMQPRNIISIVDDVRDWVMNRNSIAIKDPKNHENILRVNELEPQAVIDALTGTAIYDPVMDIIIGYGSPFAYAKSMLKSQNGAYRFFHDKFEINFTTVEESHENFMVNGVTPDGNIYQKGTAMGYDNDKGKFITVTDFVIYVHYRLIRKDEVVYIVSLVSAIDTRKHVEWKNFSTDQQVSGYVQSLGSFHIKEKSSFRLIHEYISVAKVPEVHVVEKYGLNVIKGRRYIVYADAVVDLVSMKVYEKFGDTDIFFLDASGGIRAETPAGELLYEALGEKTPYLGGVNKLTSYNELHTIMSSIFKDLTADMAMFTICSWMGNMIYEEEINSPLFFVTGPALSGKTTYAKILASVFGMGKPLSLEGTTPFPMRMGLTFLNGLPLFFSEFRTRMTGIYEKTQIIKALFDGAPFERGRKDLSIDRSEFSAAGFIEGEELPESGATRSRLIIHCLTAKGQVAGVIPEKVMKEKRAELTRFQYSYIATTKKADYDKFFIQGTEIFRDGPTRLRRNIAVIYAATACFAPGRAKEIAAKLQLVLINQIGDQERHSTGMEVIKIAGRYLQSKWCKFHIEGYYLILPWQEIAEYVQRSRTMTELAFDSYRPNLEGMGFEFGFFDVTEVGDFIPAGTKIRIDGAKIYAPNIPNEFKCNSDILTLCTEYEKNKAQ